MYTFEKEDAIKYGVEEAVMLQNIRFWVAKNEANDKHFYDGCYWTYNSMEAFAQLFPWWSLKQIRRILDTLEKKGAIITGRFNKNAYDQTKWYSTANGANCPNGQMELTKRANGTDQKGRPIPDSKPDSKPDTPLGEQGALFGVGEKSPEKKEAPYKKIVEALNAATGKKYRGDSASRSAFNARIKDGYTVDEMLRAVAAAAADDYHKNKSNYKYLTPEYLLRPSQLEKWVNQAPPQQQQEDEAARRRRQAGIQY